MVAPMDGLKALRTSLKEPITSLSSLKALLTSGLEPLDLLAPSAGVSKASSSTTKNSNDQVARQIQKLIPGCQIVLLEQVLPIWAESIEDDHEASLLVRQFFSPLGNTDNDKKGIRCLIAVSAYQTLSSFLNAKGTKGSALGLVLSLLSHLSDDYGLAEVYGTIFANNGSSSRGSFAKGTGWEGDETEPAARESLEWEEVLKVLTGLPTKVANAVGKAEADTGRRGEIELSETLLPRRYFDRLCVAVEGILFDISQRPVPDLQPMRVLLEKLQRQGLLQPPLPSRSSSRSPSLLSPMMTSLLSHLHSESSDPIYPRTFWPSLLSGLPTQTFVAIAWSFVLHLSYNTDDPSLSSPSPLAPVKVAATHLEAFLGKPSTTSPLWSPIISQLILPRSKGREEAKGSEFRVRLFACWMESGGEVVVTKFLDELVVVWTDTAEIKFGSFARLHYITHLLIMTISLLRPGHSALIKLAFYSPLLLSIQSYLSHSDTAVRRLGMLIAEILSQLTVVESPEALRERREKEIKALKKGKGRAVGQSKEQVQAEIEGLLGKMDIGSEEEDDAEAFKAGKTKTAGKQSGDGIETKVKRLDFGKSVWDGNGEGREQCRYLRSFVGLKDGMAVVGNDPSVWMLGWAKHKETETPEVAHAQGNSDKTGSPPMRTSTSPTGTPSNQRGRSVQPVDSDDDSLVGYSSSSASSSRAPSPTPSYLEEIAKDPMLNTSTRPKVERPVYIAQLIELFKAREEPDKLEVGLKWGEGLVRRKRDFGSELEENAVELATMLLALSDNFDLEEFETKRQGILIAVTACVPKLVAPYMIEQYFNNQYSLTQRSAILTALAMAARETAGLATPNAPQMARINFPSKVLPPSLHRKYISENDSRSNSNLGLIEATISGISGEVIGRSRDDTAKEVPSLVRERQLRVKRPPQAKKISEVTRDDGNFSLSESAKPGIHPPIFPYREIAAEYFILPLINRFWDHFENEMTREARGRKAYRAAGTAMILSPLSMAKYLSTLSIMIHAARHSPAFLSVIAPEALTLAVTIGSKLTVTPDEGLGATQGPGQPAFEADVIGSALELALVILDASNELDGGRTLATDGATVLMATSDWAGGLFETEVKGEATAGSAGGLSEGRTRKAAAGVLMLVSGIVEKMRHVLGWTG